ANKRFSKTPSEIPSENYVNAVRDKRQYFKNKNQLGADPWESLGPEFVGGRTRSIIFHPDTSDIMYAGGVSGGVWKSTDAGASWLPIADDLENIAVVTLAIIPNSPNIILAGTGEGVYVGRPIVRSRGVEGNGIYRSTDDGQTWQAVTQTLNNPDFKFVNKIRAAQDGTLFAATIRGVWRSSDNGDSWTLMLDQADRVGGCHEIEIQPSSSPNSLLTSCGSFETAAVFRSSDNGNSWSSVIEEDNQGRTTIAYAPSNPQRVYALSAQNQFGEFPYGLKGLYRSDDGGDNWQLVASPTSTNPNSRSMLSTTNYVFDCSNTGEYQAGRLAGGGWYYNLIVVDPTNEDRIWTGGLDLWRSDDGGENFSLGSFWWANDDEASYIHADHHLLIYHPNYDATTETRLFAGNDGGLWQTNNSTDSLASNNCDSSTSSVDWQTLNNNYAVTQFYHGSVSKDGKTLIGGSQDNGTQWRSEEGTWELINGGDGSYSAIDPKDPTNVYVSSQYAFLVKLKIQEGDNEATNITGDFSNAPGLFITPFTLDRNDNQRLFLAGLALWRGGTDGQSWAKISSDEYTMNFIDGLSAVAVQPGNSNLVILGGTDGHIFRHTSALSGHSNFEMEKIKIADGYVSSVNFDRNNPNKVVATVSTFGELHAWLSEDAGLTWVAIDQAGSEGLPDLPTHDIIVAPHDTNILYAGTDVGVYVSKDNGGTWSPLTSGLPNVPVEELVYRRNNQQTSLFAFTYGRGVFKSQITNVINIAPSALEASASLTVEQNASLAFDASEFFDDQNDDTLTYTANDLPAGLSISSDGFLSGSVSAPGNYTVILIASDSDLTANMPLNLEVTESIQTAPSSSGGSGALFYLIFCLIGFYQYRKN
ncbi:MAG: putative Ig domain-containing protein, partial [Kangiellaceae bacterium]